MVNPADAARGVVAYSARIGHCVACRGLCNTLKKSPPSQKLVLACPGCEPPYDYDRKAIVQRLREEGAEAYRKGRHAQTCPYFYMDRVQWLHGYFSVEESNAMHKMQD